MWKSVVCRLFALVLLGGCASGAVRSDLLSESVAWYTGTTGMIDDEKAKNLLLLADQSGDSLARMWRARVHSTGRMLFDEDKRLAGEIADAVIADIENLAANGNEEAMFLMGTAYAEGLGKPVEPELAAQWYRRAAVQGHMLAQHNLGNIYASGTGVPQNFASAVYWWQLAAAAGDAVPHFRLGEAFEQGLGVVADPDLAVSWYQGAARRGYARAVMALERMEVR